MYYQTTGRVLSLLTKALDGCKNMIPLKLLVNRIKIKIKKLDNLYVAQEVESTAVQVSIKSIQFPNDWRFNGKLYKWLFFRFIFFILHLQSIQNSTNSTKTSESRISIFSDYPEFTMLTIMFLPKFLPQNYLHFTQLVKLP